MRAVQEVRLAEEEVAAQAGRHVLELRDLAHLDRILESSGSSVVAVAFYSRVRAWRGPLKRANLTRLFSPDPGSSGM